MFASVVSCLKSVGALKLSLNSVVVFVFDSAVLVVVLMVS